MFSDARGWRSMNRYRCFSSQGSASDFMATHGRGPRRPRSVSRSDLRASCVTVERLGWLVDWPCGFRNPGDGTCTWTSEECGRGRWFEAISIRWSYLETSTGVAATNNLRFLFDSRRTVSTLRGSVLDHNQDTLLPSILNASKSNLGDTNGPIIKHANNWWRGGRSKIKTHKIIVELVRRTPRMLAKLN